MTQSAYAPYREKQLFAEIDWAYENPDGFTICWACTVEVTLRECLHFRARLNTFVCRRCYDSYQTLIRKSRGASHQARVKRATPKGVDFAAIHDFYFKAQLLTLRTKILHHVDHIVPLLGCDVDGEHIVSGLHVPANLQVIPWRDNLKKSNRFDPTEHHRLAPAEAHRTPLQPSPESGATAAQPHPRHTDLSSSASRPRTAMPRLVKARH